MLKANYHTHTFRCGHAGSFKDEEYVQKAIEAQFQTLGFSDHIMLPGFEQYKYRGNFDMCQNYYNSINSLKKKYKERIEILLGFEAESFPKYLPYYSELINNKIVDYLILGNHMSMDRFGRITSMFGKVSTASDLYLYYELASKAIKTNLFTIFAHPDLFLASVEVFDNDCYKISNKLIELCKQYEVYLEINVGGIRNGKKMIGSENRFIYPTDNFFDIVSLQQAKCIIGIDAHSPYNLTDYDSCIEAVQFAKKHDLILCDHINFKHR